MSEVTQQTQLKEDLLAQVAILESDNRVVTSQVESLEKLHRQHQSTIDGLVSEISKYRTRELELNKKIKSRQKSALLCTVRNGHHAPERTYSDVIRTGENVKWICGTKANISEKDGSGWV